MLDLKQDKRYLKYLSEGLNETLAKTTTIANLDGDKILCVVGYNLKSFKDINMSIYSTSKRWCGKYFLNVVFKFPFEQLKVERISATVSVKNYNTLDFVERIGFKQEGIKREFFFGVDGVSFGMLKGECKWL